MTDDTDRTSRTGVTGLPEPPVLGPLPDLVRRLETDEGSIERDLVRLVLTIVELVRQLMERQALRRVEAGGLSDEQVESLGLGLMRLEQAMAELRGRFDLTPADLNLDLGPLGTLLPEDDVTRGAGGLPPRDRPSAPWNPGRPRTAGP